MKVESFCPYDIIQFPADHVAHLPHYKLNTQIPGSAKLLWALERQILSPDRPSIITG